MTVQEVLAEIEQLSFEERIQILATLTTSLQEEWQVRVPAGSSLSRVRGLLKPDGPTPSDAELTESYLNHLLEKYS